MTTLAIYGHAGATWRLEVGGPIDLQRRAGGPEWVTVRHNVGEPIGVGSQPDYLTYLKSLVVGFLAAQHRPSVDIKFNYTGQEGLRAGAELVEKFAAEWRPMEGSEEEIRKLPESPAWQSSVHTAARRTVPLLDLCTEIDAKARAAAKRTASPLIAGLNGRYHDIGGDIGQAFTDELQAHAVATQPLVILALVAKLRRAIELLNAATDSARENVDLPNAWADEVDLLREIEVP